MTAEELERQLKSGLAPLILDVRSDFEFRSGHIKGAIHAPLANILKKTEAVSSDKGDLLVLLCEHGPRARLASILLRWHGYKNLELLTGHMTYWRQSGRAVVKGQQ